MRSAYGLSDRIGKLGSQESLVLKSSDLRVGGMGVMSQHPHGVDPKGAGQILPMRKMRSTN